MKTTPFKHQVEALDAMTGQKSFALLMEQGTGKTKVAIDDAARLYNQGKIEAVVVVAPNGVHRNWIDELDIHCDAPYAAAFFASNLKKKDRDSIEKLIDPAWTGALRILTINVEALITAKGKALVGAILERFTTCLIIDESSRIKTPKAKRTKEAIKFGRLAHYKRILTGTPVTQSPMDLYAQFAFLGIPEWFKSFYTFRACYAILKQMQLGASGRSFQQVVGFRNLDDLKGRIDPFSFRVTKDECLDLPEKIYRKRYVDLGPKQLRTYVELRDSYIAEIEAGEVLTAPLALTRMLRLQQIIGGYVPSDDGPVMAIEDNRRVDALLEEIEDAGKQKTIIWCKFRAEIEEIAKRLQDEYGKEAVVEYHGDTSGDDRAAAIKAFQDPGSDVWVFLGQVHTGGIGITLNKATHVIYYSNDFSLECRLQSEDRAHRIGTEEHVTYTDLIAQGTVDEKIVKALRSKKNVADALTGDKLKEWL